MSKDGKLHVILGERFVQFRLHAVCQRPGVPELRGDLLQDHVSVLQDGQERVRGDRSHVQGGGAGPAQGRPGGAGGSGSHHRSSDGSPSLHQRELHRRRLRHQTSPPAGPPAAADPAVRGRGLRQRFPPVVQMTNRPGPERRTPPGPERHLSILRPTSALDHVKRGPGPGSAARRRHAHLQGKCVF